LSELPTDGNADSAPGHARPRRWLVRLGLALAALGLLVFVGGLALEALIGLKAVSVQAVAFPAAVVALVLGLVLAFAGWGLGVPGAAARPAGGDAPLEVPRRQRRAVLGLSLGALAAVCLLGIGTARSLLLADSNEVCTSCHAALGAETSAHVASPHSRVACADCHVAPGVGSFAHSKLVGLQEFAAYLSGQWKQPIPAPVANLRPTQEACERCHWPEKFVGDLAMTHPHFAPDEANTRTDNSFLVHTGGGTPSAVDVSGIHSSMVAQNEVRYVATDRELQNIPWVESTGQDGKTAVYQDTKAPLAASPSPEQIRRLDCIDCHNRPAHIFPTPDRALDASLDTGAIDRSLPFVKREALAALDQPYPDTATARQQIESKLRGFYQESYPSLVGTKGKSIDQAISAVQGIYSRSFFPKMKVDWRSYPDNLGHQSSPGCFRCHDGKHVSETGQAIPSACDTCHTLPQKKSQQASGAPVPEPTPTPAVPATVPAASGVPKAIPHPIEGRADCLSCHASGAQAVPASHKGRTNETCQSCHKMDATASSKPSAKAIPHSIAGFSACLNCHASGPQTVPSDHAGRTNDTCQSCHSPSPSATVAPTQAATKIPHVFAGNADCLSCHASGAQAVPADHAGRTNETCQSCHQPDTTVAAIPHVVAGFGQCLSCHAQGPNAVPASHKGWTNDTCQFCHVANPRATTVPKQTASKIPHLLAGNSDCLRCHASGSQAVPADHAGRTNDTCQSCHQPDATVAAIPHVVVGFGQCLSCHAQGPNAVPASHKGRTNDTCQFCHVANPKATGLPTQSAATIPHVILGREACLRCHASGVQAVPADHAGRTDNTCQACHKQDPSAANAAQIKHTVARFGDCLGCHAAGQYKVPADHAGRGNATCLECHAQSPTARVLPAGAPMPHSSSIPPCLNCHRVGGGGETSLPSSHAGRTSNVCRICH